MQLITSVIQLILSVISIISMYKIYEKMGLPGWGVLVPFYNFYLLIVVGLERPMKEFIFCLIPIVNIYFVFINWNRMLKGFGKDSIGFLIGTLILPFIFLPKIAFNEDKFTKVIEN